MESNNPIIKALEEWNDQSDASKVAESIEFIIDRRNSGIPLTRIHKLLTEKKAINCSLQCFRRYVRISESSFHKTDRKLNHSQGSKKSKSSTDFSPSIMQDRY